jgi:hypothetical protein
MNAKMELHEVDSAAEAWLPETVEVKPEDDFAPAIARVKGTIRKTPSAVVLEQDRRSLANYLPFWDDIPEDMVRAQFRSLGETRAGDYTI